MTPTLYDVLVMVFLTTLVLSIVLTIATYFMFRKMFLLAGEGFAAKTVTVLKCPLCSYTIRRSFREGDHIGAVSESERCPIHNVNLVVHEIYKETPGKHEE